MNGDDERNSKMSNLAQDNDLMHKALHEISEIWVGSDGVICSTHKEKYLQLLCVQMYRHAINVLNKTE